MAKMTKKELDDYVYDMAQTEEEKDALIDFEYETYANGAYDSFIIMGCLTAIAGVIGRFGKPIIAKIFKH